MQLYVKHYSMNIFNKVSLDYKNFYNLKENFFPPSVKIQ